MIYLGIDSIGGAFFCGASMTAGERVHPQPLVTPVAFAAFDEKPDWESAAVVGQPKFFFVEDQYDFQSRLRRGRIFRWEQGGAQWFVRDPFRQDLGNATAKMGNRFEMRLTTYQCDRLLGFDGQKRPKAYLGDQIHSTRWNMVAIEGAAIGGPVVTLRSDSYLGILPEIDPATTPAEIRAELENCVERVASSTGGIDPGATIDCCRHALAVSFGYQCGDRTLDLVRAIEKRLRSDKSTEGIHIWAARIVARLHARTKPNEARKRPTRPVDDGDALLALECLAVVLKDLGWGKLS